MILEMKAPNEASLTALLPVIPVFISYHMSYVYIGIYWNNHHHLMQAVNKINGKVLWANLHLLFWLSLIPFVTSWVGENHLEPEPVALYGVILLMSGIAYRILELQLLKNSPYLSEAFANGVKEKVSTVMYMAAIPLGFRNVWISIVYT